MTCVGELAIFGKETEEEPTDNSCGLFQMHQCHLRGAETHKSHFALHLPFSTDTEANTKVISAVMNMYKYSHECDIKVTTRLFWRKKEARMPEVTREGNMEERKDKIAYFLSHAKSDPTLYLPIRRDSRGETVGGGRDGNEA